MSGRSWLLLSWLALASCFDNARVDNGVSTEAATSSVQAGTGAPRRVRVPDVRTPEESLAGMLREFRVLDAEGRWERYSEQLRSDGQGAFRLDVLEYQEGGQAQFGPPTGELLGTYERRQRFFVHYRDLRIRDSALAHHNYVWTERAGTVSVAGRPCRVYRADSRHGFGALELNVDDATGTLLGWALLGKGDHEVQRLEVGAVDLSPDLNGVIWSQPSASERAYTGSAGDLALLGFTPLAIDYLPEGFVRDRELIMLPVEGSIAPLYLEVFHDGLQVLLVAQQASGAAAGGSPTDPLRFARNTTTGGVGVVEGEVGVVSAFIVGALPLDELKALLGSMRAAG